MRDDFWLLGKVTSVFGIKGWVKVYSYTSPPEQLLNYSNWHLAATDELQPVTFVGQRHGKGLIACINGCDTPEKARLFCGRNIYIPRHSLPELPQDEYYWNQLIGLQVFDLQSQLLGRVDHLIETGANDVLVVRGCKGSLDDRERLIPWVLPEVVRQVDLVQQRLLVDWDAEF